MVSIGLQPSRRPQASLAPPVLLSPSGSYTDLNGNLGTSGSDTAGVDTQGPSVVVNIVDDVLTVGETSEVTFTFSEKVTGF
ncbi:Uncharacterised protein [Shewanella putrefaciens]|nr:Uncharacterised protein [Shewanella putrefaciens]